MPEWIAVTLAGMVGGVAHALVFYGQITMPKWYDDDDGRRHWMPGIIGTLFIGGVASLVFWGLYSQEVSWSTSAEVRPVIGGLLIGVAGDRALKQLVNQAVLQSDKDELQHSVAQWVDITEKLLPEETENSDGANGERDEPT